jgi:hypothetical protein
LLDFACRLSFFDFEVMLDRHVVPGRMTNAPEGVAALLLLIKNGTVHSPIFNALPFTTTLYLGSARVMDLHIMYQHWKQAALDSHC